ncbi:MAG: ATP-binding protein [Rhodospirillaceae bacterium]
MGGISTRVRRRSQVRAVTRCIDQRIDRHPPVRRRCRSDKGWGLGLAITHSEVGLHKGSVNIESALGKGTTITVYLPSEPA